MASMSKEEREDMARSFAFFRASSFLWKTDPNQATSSADEYWLAIIIGQFEPSNLTKMMCLELTPCSRNGHHKRSHIFQEAGTKGASRYIHGHLQTLAEPSVAKSSTC
ncbi:hypothetical protein NC653_009592 [Populus alba x Populus x berolinensis]|uniref:Uncharacterized protein n=1 Tax=Populus alba x Populus x berolinensis TaxID=444605 RepID=A0AAD6R9C7_9ROSI|nr:hypothetical protein NC653_009592 [Populus alba x Populus x berolinensis]